MPLIDRDLIAFCSVQFEGVDQFVDRLEAVTTSASSVSNEPFEFSKVGSGELAGLPFPPVTGAHLTSSVEIPKSSSQS